MKTARTRHVAANTTWQWFSSVSFAFAAYAFFMWYHAVRGKDYGWWTTEKCAAIAAVCCLALALALGPISRFAPVLGKLLPWRRSLGLTGAFFAAVHVIMVIVYLPFWMPENYPLSWYFEHWFTVVMGVLNTTLFLIIAWHSYPSKFRKLGKRKWMILQKFSYLLMFFIVLHLLSMGKIPKNWIAWLDTRDKPFPPGSFPTMVICLAALFLKIADLLVHGDSLAAPTNPGSDVDVQEE